MGIVLPHQPEEHASGMNRTSLYATGFLEQRKWFWVHSCASGLELNIHIHIPNWFCEKCNSTVVWFTFVHIH